MCGSFKALLINTASSLLFSSLLYIFFDEGAHCVNRGCVALSLTRLKRVRTIQRLYSD